MNAREKELRRMNTTELRSLARDLNVKGRSNMTSDQLVKAIAKAERELDEETEPFQGGDEPDEDEEFEDEETEEPEPITAKTGDEPSDHDALSVTDFRRITQGDSETLRQILQRADLETHLREAITKELEQRDAKAAAEEKRKSLKTELVMYTVTKGGRFITNGQITQLATGSTIGPFTHDLEEVRRQGIEFKPRTAVVVGENQMGQQTSKAV